MRNIFVITFVLCLVVVPAMGLAHGGVSKNVGNSVVYLNQTPLSPFVGEKVDLIFTFTDSNFHPIKNTDIELDLIDTFLNDASRDQKILTKDLHTDENGNFVFSYQFPQTDYYDVEITFKDPVSGETDNTGFLVQPRSTQIPKSNPWKYLGILVVGLILGLGISKIYKKT